MGMCDSTDDRGPTLPSAGRAAAQAVVALRLFATRVVAVANAARRPYDIDRCRDEAIIAFQAFSSASRFPRRCPEADWQEAAQDAFRDAIASARRDPANCPTGDRGTGGRTLGRDWR